MIIPFDRLHFVIGTNKNDPDRVEIRVHDDDSKWRCYILKRVHGQWLGWTERTAYRTRKGGLQQQLTDIKGYRYSAPNLPYKFVDALVAWCHMEGWL